MLFRSGYASQLWLELTTAAVAIVCNSKEEGIISDIVAGRSIAWRNTVALRLPQYRLQILLQVRAIQCMRIRCTVLCCVVP